MLGIEAEGKDKAVKSWEQSRVAECGNYQKHKSQRNI